MGSKRHKRTRDVPHHAGEHRRRKFVDGDIAHGQRKRSATELGARDPKTKSWLGVNNGRVRNADGTLQTPPVSSLVLPYNPGPIAIGSSGTLFVTDEGATSLFVYAKGATGYDQPKRELSLPFLPSCVAVDRAGHEFVGGFSNGYVAVYAPGAQGNAQTLQRIAFGLGVGDFSTRGGWTWLDHATHRAADAIGLKGVTGEIAAGRAHVSLRRDGIRATFLNLL